MDEPTKEWLKSKIRQTNKKILICNKNEINRINEMLDKFTIKELQEALREQREELWHLEN